MAAVTLKDVKELVKKEKMMACNPKRMTYSKVVEEKISILTKTIPTRELAQELKLSRSFIGKLKKRSLEQKVEDNSSPIQLLDLSNSFMKGDTPEVLPIVKFTTARGLTIEIFE